MEKEPQPRRAAPRPALFRPANSALLPLCLAALAPAQSDLVVGPGGAFATLPAAVAAAQPGDRILIAQDQFLFQPVVIDKPLTICSAPGSRRFVDRLSNGFGASELFTVTALPSGQTLLLTGVDFRLFRMTGPATLLRTPTPVQGSIRLDDCAVQDSVQWDVGVAIDVAADELWLRACSIVQQDQPPDGACIDSSVGFDAGGCVRFGGRLLVVEDCLLRAASGAWLQSHPTNCFGCDPSGSYSRPSPLGGFALHSFAHDSILVRTTLQDGNGGGAQPPLPPCGSIGIPSPAGISSIAGMQAYALQWQLGLPGQLTAMPPGMDAPRGAWILVGDPDAPLRLGGNAALGGQVQATSTNANGLVCAMALTVGWNPAPSPFGPIAVDAAQVLLVDLLLPTDTRSYAVPNDPALHLLPLTAQLISILGDGSITAANPSGLSLRRP